MKMKYMEWVSGAIATAIVVFGLVPAQAALLIPNAAESVPDVTKSSFDLNNASVDRLILSLGAFLPSANQQAARNDAKATSDQNQSVPEWTKLNPIPLSPHGSFGGASSIGSNTDKSVLPPAEDSALPTNAPMGQDSLRVGEFDTSPSAGTPNYFGEVLDHEQAVTPDSPNPSTSRGGADAYSAQLMVLPTNPDAGDPVTFSNLGVPMVSRSTDTAAGQIANGVALSTPNDEIDSADPVTSNISILDLIGNDEGPIDPRQAMLALEIRHTLIDVREALSNLNQVINDISLVNPPQRGHEPGADVKQRNATEGSESFGNRRRELSADESGAQNQFADRVIHIVAAAALIIRNYFWIFMIIFITGLTLRWALKRH